MTDEGALHEFRDDPDHRAALEAVLEVDEASDTWAFEDVPVDTGRFGRFVDRGIVEKAGGGYRLVDPDAVRRAVEDGQAASDTAAESSTEEAERGLTEDLDLSAVSTGRLPAVGVTVAVIALFVWTRAYIYPDVFRGGDIVLTANDPYYYRYAVERLLAVSTGPLDLATLTELRGTGSGQGPIFAGRGEPLFLATLWLAASLLGGNATAAGTLLAWYPVGAALLTGALVYLVGARILGDHRVGLVAAISLALIPGFAFRTSLGFGDHHAFDYIWLMATVASLLWVVALDPDDPFARPASWAAGALGVSIAGQTLAWEGSPLVLLALAGYLAVKVPLDVLADRSPLRENAPVLLATGIAAALTLGCHLALGWHSIDVAVVPTLLLVGGLGLATAGDFVRDRDLGVEALLSLEIGGPLVGLVALFLIVPGTVMRLLGGVSFLFLRSNIAEKEPTFTLESALGLELLGPFVLLGLPVMVWGLRRAAAGDRQWLALSAFGWWLLFLTALQLRFAAHLATLLAVFSGISVVWILARVDLTALPVPVQRARSDAEREVGDENRPEPESGPPTGGTRWVEPDSLTVRSGVATLLVVALVVGVSGFYLPGEVEGSIVDDETYQTAKWMNTYADEQGWRYPENYVFSRWGTNRVYNYFVSGVSQNYSRAQSNYTKFVYNDSQASAAWYDRLRNDTGFVVIEPLPRNPGTIQQHLYVTYGSRWTEAVHEAVSHYRAVYASASTRKKVFTLVPGATVIGTAPANVAVEARTTVEIPNESFLYRQQAETGSDGEFELGVPYPGEYEFTAGNETWTATVPEAAVQNGTAVRIGE
ncbi:STT3 domain-containing protein [Halosimplex sp. TS25]|uniref:STT3 domain-containing protein n=1 Tax=Halosimplex rarum TaxID=3396619 RepID=UPI0039EA7A9F